MTPLRPSLRDRLVAGIGTVVLTLLFGYLLVIGLTVRVFRIVDPSMTVLAITPPPAKQRQKPPGAIMKTRASASASPRNARSVPTAVVAPPPVVPPVLPLPVVSAPVAGAGVAASAGASSQAGPGEGAGGAGDGSGGDAGDGGAGGDDVPPRLIRGKMSFADLPPALRTAGIGGIVGVRYSVEVDGRVDDCRVTASSGSAALDTATCVLIEQRYRYKPSRDPAGRPVGTDVVENHRWIVDRNDAAPKPGP